MLSELKRVFFDYSENCKQEIMYMLKKTIAFLIFGLITYPFMDKVEWLGGIGGILLLIFGFQWGRSLLGTVGSLMSVFQNAVIKYFILIIGFIIICGLGYVYFLWSLIKLLIIFIKNKS